MLVRFVRREKKTAGMYCNGVTSYNPSYEIIRNPI